MYKGLKGGGGGGVKEIIDYQYCRTNVSYKPITHKSTILSSIVSLKIKNMEDILINSKPDEE